MKHEDSVIEAFGTTAAAYLSSPVHAAGADLKAFACWTAHMRTPPARVEAVRSLWNSASEEVRHYFRLQEDFSFSLTAIMIEAIAFSLLV